jgi:hypothetical protein
MSNSSRQKARADVTPRLPTTAPSGRDARALGRAHLLSKVDQDVKGRAIRMSTSEASAAKLARVLAAVSGVAAAPATPTALSRAERYNNRSAEKEKPNAQKMMATASPANKSVLLLSSSSDDGIKKNHTIINVPPELPRLFLCAAGHLCMSVDKPHSADCLVCVNCNRLAHEQCVELILLIWIKL